MTSKYQLKNGLNVLLVESHKSPVVSIQMWVKTGSADETKGIEGISHFIEHLVFKGTEKYGVGSIASAIEGAGGVLNAYTTFDQTVFYVTLSKTFAETGFDVISEMMLRPKFDSKEIDNEREVVIEEIKRSIDNPNQQASRLLFSTAYKKHPYGIPVIGYEENIRKVSRKQIVKYFESRYVPQNMTLVVVGDFKAKDMKKKIEEYFGPTKKRKLMKAKRVAEPVQLNPRINIKSTEFNESFLYLSWPMPKANHKDINALSVIAMIVGQGESSRLVHRIKNEKQLVNSVGMSSFSPREPGLIAVSATLNNEKLAEVTSEIRLEIMRFINDGPTQEELQRAIRLLESDQYYSMETVDGLAGLYGHYEFLFGDYKYFNRSMKATAKLTAKELMRVAKKYLNPQKMCISYLLSGESSTAKNILDETVKQFQSKHISERRDKVLSKDKKVKAIKWSVPKTDKVSAAEKYVLPSGATMLIKTIKGSPVVCARYGFLGGLRVESDQQPGASELASRVWPASSKTQSEVQINNRIEGMASGFGGFGGRNSMGLSLTSLQPNFLESLEIMNDVLLNYKISPEIVSREKLLMTEYLKARSDKPAQKCILGMMSALFEGHPYAKDPYGNASDIAKLNEKSIVEQVDKSLLSANMTISVVGDVDKNKLKKIMTSVTDKMARGNRVADAFSLKDLRERKKSFIEMNKAQTHVVLAYRGLTFRDSDRFALEVMQSILSGQGGRLFIELRDKESLAYSVSPLRMDGIDTGYFGAYIACSPEKTEKAVKMLRAEFTKLGELLVSKEELERSKRYLLGRHDIALQKTGHVADFMLFDEMYGLEFNEFESYHDKLLTVTPDDIRNVARRIFAQPEVLSIVGKSDAN
ncbi:MAG: insulinase family protein [Bdellovibrionales bacterium]|nr:insulinase family protein [Bdellovibrionales bacterium]